MKKTLSFVLALVMLFSLCCTGTAFADAPSPVEAFSGIGRGLSRGVHASLSGASEKAAPAEAAALVNELKPLVKDASCDVVVCVPAVDI